MNLTETPAKDTAAPLDPGQVRLSAVSCIAYGTTPHDLRTGAVAASPALTPLWHAWADAIEDLAARGLTRQHAVRAMARLRPAPSASRPRAGFEHPGTARQAAIIFLAAGHTGDDVRRMAAPRDILLAELADAIDALAAEGLDQAACRKIAGLEPLPSGGAL